MHRAERPGHVTCDQAQDVIAAAGIDARVVATSPLGEGVKSVVSRIEFEAAEPLALKVFRHEGYAAREHVAYRMLGEHQLPMPRMLHGVEKTPAFPIGYTLLTMVPGEPLIFNFGGLARERLLDVYRGVGALQAALHQTVVTSKAGNAEYIEARIDQSLGKFLLRGGKRRLAKKLESYFDERAELFAACTEPALCHGDLHPENILVAGNLEDLHFLGAIDFESAFTGDPVMDLTRTIQSCPLPGEDLTAALLDGYGGKPEGFDERHNAYFVLYELELWNYYARGGSRRPLRSIARSMRRRIER
ncbi:MAG: phosphotransferase family protein [Solirubrobacterales bacterium]